MSNEERELFTNQVAVIGMESRFPGAPDVASFWELLREGRESIRFLSGEELERAGVPAALRDAESFVPAVSTLEGLDRFDASFFGFSPREAEAMDPQLRFFLECSWAALESAGYDPRRFAGTIGVYAGMSHSSYLWQHVLARRPSPGAAAGLEASLLNAADSLSTLVSYKLDLTGPSCTVQTACSSSLVAVHLACQSLLSGECDMVLAGGVSLQPEQKGYIRQEGGILSADGHCRAFDARATGTVSGSGIGIVVLRRMADAIQDGDPIRAVILGSAMNNDGAAKAGFTAPSVTGHARVVTEALAVAGVDPETIGYVEAHGTGTELGDPVEIEALTRAFREHTARRSFCAIGSVKSNIGHLDHAAGIASFIKSVLSLEHGRIPASLHFETPNPKIDFEASPFYVSTRLVEWPRGARPRRAGVSSLGMGGTNAHVILEEPLRRTAPATDGGAELLVLSARSASALEAATDRLARHLKDHPGARLADVAFTLQEGRRRFASRRILVAADAADAARALASRAAGRVVSASEQPNRARSAFLFPGQGSQHPGMGRGLYERYPSFRETVDRCCRILDPHLGFELKKALYAETGSEAAQELARTEIAQPALFVTEYALAQLWRSWGIEPDAMIGHSIGEYVAAALAGVFSLEDALALIALRGRLMQELPAGAMMAVPLGLDEVSALLEPDLSVAAVNAPDQSVVSGTAEAIERFAARLSETGKRGLPLKTSHAFHSALMDPVLADFESAVARCRLAPPAIPIASNRTGGWLTAEQAQDPRYWAEHLRHTVLFGAGLRTLLDAAEILLEVGPGRTLTDLVRRQPAVSASHRPIASLGGPRDGRADPETLLEAAGRCWMAGAVLDWGAVHRGERRFRIPLPTYPFERRRYWIERASRAAERAGAEGEPVRRGRVAEWIYLPAWTSHPLPIPAPAAERATTPGRTLVLSGGGALSRALVERLRRAGDDIVEVESGDRFVEREGGAYAIDPGVRQDYVRLFDALRSADRLPDRVLHLWALDPAPHGLSERSPDEDERLFCSLVFLAQSLRAQEGTSCRSIRVVSSGAEAFGQRESIAPVRAMLRSACLAVRQEYPGLFCGSIDVEPPPPGDSGGIAARAAWIEAELANEDPAPRVALRDGLRSVPAYVPPSRRSGGELRSAWREEGVYLITGGLGKIGLALAEHLCRRGARVVLTTRSDFPERESWEDWLGSHEERDLTHRRIRRLARLQETRGEVLIVRADAADARQMKQAVARAIDRFGALHGAIHAAGVLDRETPRALPGVRREDCRRVFRPKVQGTLALDEALAGQPLDFILLMSSLSVEVGGLGYGVYAAANAFMDAFAHERHRMGDARWVSVCWDAWQLEPAASSGRPGEGSEPSRLALRTAEGIEALERLLALGRTPRVLVSTVDLERRVARWTRLPVAGGAREAEGEGESEASVRRHPRPDVQSTYVSPEDPLEERLAGIWGDLLGIDRVGAHDNFFELGGTSLLGLQLIARLEADLGVKLPAAALFEAPTVRSLRSLLGTKEVPGGSMTPPAATAAMPDAEEMGAGKGGRS